MKHGDLFLFEGTVHRNNGALVKLFLLSWETGLKLEDVWGWGGGKLRDGGWDGSGVRMEGRDRNDRIASPFPLPTNCNPLLSIRSWGTLTCSDVMWIGFSR